MNSRNIRGCEILNKKIKIILMCLLISLTIFWGVKKYINVFKNIRIEIDLMVQKDLDFQLFYTQDLNKNFNETESIKTKIEASPGFKKIYFDLKKVEKIEKLRIDLGEFPGELSIKIIKISGNKKIELNPKTILNFFKNEIENMKIVNNRLLVSSNSKDPYIILDSNLIKIKRLKTYDISQSITILIVTFFGAYKLINYIDKKKRNLSWNKLIYIIMFFIVLIFPVIRVDNEKIDTVENRNLALKSKLIKNEYLNTKFGVETEKWLNDHFYKRRKIIDLYEKVNNLILNRIENEKAFLGKENWLFYKGENSIENFKNSKLFTENQLKIINKNLKNREQWLEKQNIKYYTFVGPDKNKIYGEYFPKYISKINSLGKVHQLREYLKKDNIKIIYPFEELIDEKKNGVLYWKTDTHWNSYGGYIGYKKLMKEIKKEFPNIAKVKEENLTIKFEPYLTGDLLNMLNLDKKNYKNITYKNIQLKNKNFKYIKNEGINGVITSSNKPYKVLVFRDSFGNAITSYLSETFGEVEYIWNYNFNDFQDKIKEFKPDIIIFEMVERNIGVLEADSPKLKGGIQ